MNKSLFSSIQREGEAVSKEVTREDMEVHLVHWIINCGKDDCKEYCTKDAIKQCRRAEKAIRSLIKKFYGEGGWQQKAAILSEE